ncbi:MAG: NfeD family protein [Pseudomonadota bacterium]
MDIIFSSITIWHWLVLGLVLVGIEMMFGTFDLLFVSIAAFATALFTALMPEVAAGWEVQAAAFGAMSIGLVIMGRTVFAGMRRIVGEHPTLNRRMDSLVGQRGKVTATFSAGQGRVKIGDTEWMASSPEASNLIEGTAIVVERTQQTQVIVRAI